jgi:hypothetical protein
LITTFLPALALAAEGVQVEYSAIQTQEMSAGVMTGPVSFTPSKQRSEMDMHGQKVITITRRDKGVIWQLMPDQKMYMEHKIGQSPGHQSETLDDFTIETTDIGPDTINGIATIKSKLIMTSKTGEKYGGFSWRTADGITVKSDAIAIDGNSKHRIKMELTDLVVGPQDPANFEIPPGYAPMNMSKMMMHGMMNDEDLDDDEVDPAAAAPPPAKKKWGLKGALDILKGTPQ